MKKIFAIVLSFIMLAVVGCKAPTPGAQETAENFLNAIKSCNFESANNMINKETPESQSLINLTLSSTNPQDILPTNTAPKEFSEYLKAMPIDITKLNLSSLLLAAESFTSKMSFTVKDVTETGNTAIANINITTADGTGLSTVVNAILFDLVMSLGKDVEGIINKHIDSATALLKKPDFKIKNQDISINLVKKEDKWFVSFNEQLFNVLTGDIMSTLPVAP